jgi:hypothetical protein
VLIVQGPAVGDVQAPDPDAAARGSHGAGFLDRVLAGLPEDGLVREPALDVLEPYAGCNGHAVPLVDTEVRHLVAHPLEQLPRKIVVLALGLLDGKDVTVSTLQPALDTVGTGTERVHIPGSYLHSS